MQCGQVGEKTITKRVLSAVALKAPLNSRKLITSSDPKIPNNQVTLQGRITEQPTIITNVNE